MAIFEEWRHVLERKGIPEDEIESRLRYPNIAFPDALVSGFEGLEQSLWLPDSNDRHVLAAAIEAGAQMIVTHNIKDFPDEALSPYNIAAMTPDDFLAKQVLGQPTIALQAFLEMTSVKKNPLIQPVEMLNYFRAAGLDRTVNQLEALL